MPLTPELLKWIISTGLTIPLLLYVVYHIKYGKIAMIYNSFTSIIKVLLAIARTNDDVDEEQVKQEFMSGEPAVADFISVSEDPERGSDEIIAQRDD